MKAIIMAGGEGSRLRPLTDGCPKPMVSLLGRPLLDYIFELLKKHGMTEVCATLRYMPEAITGRFGDGSALGMNITYHVESEPLGTAGGVRACQSFIGGGDVLIISGDAACDFDLTELMEYHKREQPAVTMALYPHFEPMPYGGVLTDTSGRVLRFIEKPNWERVITDLVNTGIYIVSPRAIDMIPEASPFDFAKDLFPLLMERGEEIRAIPLSGYWCDVGSPEAYLQCSMDALEGRLNIDHGIRETSPGIRSASDIPPNVTLSAPCLIGEGVAINSGAMIGPGAVIGDHSRIGGGAIIKRSVVDGARVGAGSTVTGAVLCRGAVVPPVESVKPGEIVGPSGLSRTVNRQVTGGESGHREPLNASVELPCGNRARLMRALSESLAEFGADFTDGLSLRTGKGLIRISPLPDRPALIIEASAREMEASRELAEEYGSLARSLDYSD